MASQSSWWEGMGSLQGSEQKVQSEGEIRCCFSLQGGLELGQVVREANHGKHGAENKRGQGVGSTRLEAVASSDVEDTGMGAQACLGCWSLRSELTLFWS